MTIEQLARLLADAFEVFDREPSPGLDQPVKLRDGSPEWMRDLCRNAHDNAHMMPDDWRYHMIAAVAEAIAEDGEDYSLDGLVPVYTNQLTGWLHSRADRHCYVDEWAEETGAGCEDFIALLSGGFLQELQEVAGSVFNDLEARALELEDEGDDEVDPSDLPPTFEA